MHLLMRMQQGCTYWQQDASVLGWAKQGAARRAMVLQVDISALVDDHLNSLKISFRVCCDFSRFLESALCLRSLPWQYWYSVLNMWSLHGVKLNPDTLCDLAIIVFFFFASLGFRVAHYLLFEASWHSLYRGTFSLLGLRDQLYLSNKFGLSLSQFISILGA